MLNKNEIQYHFTESNLENIGFTSDVELLNFYMDEIKQTVNEVLVDLSEELNVGFENLSVEVLKINIF